MLLKVRFCFRVFQDLNDLSKYCNISIKILLAIPQKYLTLLTVLACKYLMLNVTQLHDGINHVVRLWRLHHLKFWNNNNFSFKIKKIYWLQTTYCFLEKIGLCTKVISLKVHSCRFKNLPIALSSHGNNMWRISHQNSFYFLRYSHVRYSKSLLINIQKQ